MDQLQPADADPAIERLEQLVDRVGVGEVVAGAQAWAVSRQKPTRSVGSPARGDRLGDGGQLVDVDAHAEPAAGRVLEDEVARRRVAGAGGFVVGLVGIGLESA